MTIASRERSEQLGVELNSTASARQQTMKTTDLLVSGGGQDGILRPGSVEDSGAAIVDTPARQRRRMGDVYPIMKGTIYSDEECDEEVRLTACDCGALFVRYVIGLFQYFTRHPKVMGFVLTTLVLLLSMKYAQLAVLETSQAAVGTFPGLEPSSELKGIVTAFAEELHTLEGLGQALGQIYKRANITSYSSSSTVASELSTFLLLSSTTTTTSPAVRKAYVLYEIVGVAGAGHWGQVGCGADVGNSPLCFFVNSTNYLSQLTGTSVSDEVGSGAKVYMEEVMPEVEALRNATAGDAVSLFGMWSRPVQRTSLFVNETSRTISFLQPIIFDSEDGHCVAVVGIDIAVESFMTSIVDANAPSSQMELIVVDGDYNATDGGQFVYDSFDAALFWSTPYGVLRSPSRRVNELAHSILSRDGQTLLQNSSRWRDGLLYTSVEVLHRWTFITSTPLVDMTSEASAALLALWGRLERTAATIGGAYVSCEEAATAATDSRTVEMIGQMAAAFEGDIYSLYVSYPLSPSSSSGDGNSNSSSADSMKDVSRRGSDEALSSSYGSDGSDSLQSRASSTSSSTVEALASGTAGPSSAGHDDSSSSDTSSTAMSLPTAATLFEARSCGGCMLSKRTEIKLLRRDLLTRPDGSTPLTAAESADQNVDGGSSSSPSDQLWGACGCANTSHSTAQCFYTNSNQIETTFDAIVRSSAVEVSHLPFDTTGYHRFIQQYIEGRIQDSSDFWTRPYASAATYTGTILGMMSYIYPFQFDEGGAATAAVVVELTTDRVAQVLKSMESALSTAFYLIDSRDGGLFVASSAGESDSTIYSATSTNNNTVNSITSAVYDMTNGSWATPLSFRLNGSLVNYRLVGQNWGIIEIIPGDAALNYYLPAPEISNIADALRLLSASQRVVLCICMSTVLLAYVLNLVILCCSRLGNQLCSELQLQQ